MTAGITALGALSSRVHRVVRAGNREGPREETSMLAFFSILLANRRAVLISMLTGTVIFGAFALSQAELYVSRASFLVKGARAPIQLPGGAAALGISLAAYAEFSQSIVFYSDLADAKTILKAAAADEYLTSDSKGVKRTLAQIMKIKASSPEAAASLAADQLASSVSSTINTRSGVVRIAVEATDPLLAQELATNIIDELDRWSRDRVHTQAIAEREFIQQRVDEARAEMDRSEDAVKNFLAENASYEQSPQLLIDYNRLTRDVQMRQQIYTALSQSFEQAKIEEVRRPVTLNVVEGASYPINPQRSEALRQTLLGLVAGLLVGIVIALINQRVGEKRLA
jgi:uncharacterized protein involved in exopolysaccharide biosynthesis